MVRSAMPRGPNGSTAVREIVLHEFLSQCTNATASDLEAYFGDCGSLFLARLTAWLRLTYMVGTCLDSQLKAISIFLSAASGHYFLVEFLEVGGLLTVLEIVHLKSAKDKHQLEAMKLLALIVCKGRQYKELFCESHGLKIVAECLALTSSSSLIECAKDLLLQLSMGNPSYQNQIYKVFITLLSSTSHQAQRTAAYCIRQIQPSISTVSPSIVDPSLQLLRSLHVDVQCEAAELIKELVNYKDIQDTILNELVRLLKPSVENTGTSSAALPAHIQQAGAAKVIGLLVHYDDDIVRQLVELRVVRHLLYAMSNISYPDCQRQAALSLFALVNTVGSAKDEVKSLLGENLFQQLMSIPEDFYSILTPAQVDVLNSSLR
eukprot:Em0010g721a